MESMSGKKYALHPVAQTRALLPPKNPQRRNIEYWHGFVRCGNVADKNRDTPRRHRVMP